MASALPLKKDFGMSRWAALLTGYLNLAAMRKGACFSTGICQTFRQVRFFGRCRGEVDVEWPDLWVHGPVLIDLVWLWFKVRISDPRQNGRRLLNQSHTC